MDSTAQVKSSEEQLDWLPKELQDVLSKGFRVVKAVSLQNMSNSDIRRKVNFCKRNNEEIENLNISKKKSRKSISLIGWDFEQKFPNKKMALEFLSDNNWTINANQTYKLSDGHKVDYRCNWLNVNGSPCNILRCLFYPVESAEVFMFTTNREHIHHVDQTTCKPDPIENWDQLISSELVSLEQIKNDNDVDLNPIPIDVLPLQCKETKLIANSNSNTDTILKEELIIEDNLTSSVLNENDGSNSISNIPNNCANSNDSNVVTPYMGGFLFKEKFSNVPDALYKIRQMSNCWNCTCTRQQGLLRYYRCYHTYNGGICSSRAILLVRPEFEDVLYYDSGQHIHSTNSKTNNNSSILNECIIPLISDDAKKLGGWKLETQFCDYKSATDYMQKMHLISLEAKGTEKGFEEYYKCNLEVGAVEHCPASCFLQYMNLTSVILLYIRNVKHVSICTHTVRPLVCKQNQSTYHVQLNNIPILDKSDNVVKQSSLEQIKSLRGNKTHIIEKKFKTFFEALSYLEKQRIWKYKKHIQLNGYFLKVYQCNQIDSRGLQCTVTKFIRYEQEKHASYLYKTNQNHIHEIMGYAGPIEQAFETLDEDPKTKVKELAETHGEPEHIPQELELTDFELSFQQKLCGWNRKYQDQMQKQYSSISSSNKAFQNWFTLISRIPSADNEHQPYCVSHYAEGNSRHGSNIRGVLSTRNLLRNALISNSIHINSSYRLNCQKQFFTIIGTTDVNHKFQVFGIAISTERRYSDYEFMLQAIQKGVQECYNQVYKPEYLITDDRKAVCDPFNRMFGPKVASCPKIALQKIILSLNDSSVHCLAKNPLKEDIFKVLKLSSRTIFLKASNLFVQKWRSRREKVNCLLTSFNFWVCRISNWFHVFPNFTPDTNQAIRLENDMLRQNIQGPNINFTISFNAYLEKISRSSKKKESIIYDKLTIPSSIHQKAIGWKNLQKQYKCIDNVSETQYYFPAGDEKLICEKKFKEYQEGCQETFDKFFEIHYSFWCVARSKSTGTFTCSCPQFWDDSLCEHSVGMKLLLEPETTILK